MEAILKAIRDYQKNTKLKPIEQELLRDLLNHAGLVADQLKRGRVENIGLDEAGDDEDDEDDYDFGDA